MRKFTQGPWRVGSTGESVVADHPTGPMDEESLKFYGGHLVCESVFRPGDMKLIAAAPDLVEALANISNEIETGSCTADSLDPIYKWAEEALKKAGVK